MVKRFRGFFIVWWRCYRSVDRSQGYSLLARLKTATQAWNIYGRGRYFQS
jgi:hypothetical protein